MTLMQLFDVKLMSRRRFIYVAILTG